MKTGFASPKQRRVGRVIVAGLMLSLWLGLNLLALSPQLHHWLHKDSQSLTHHCVITQLDKGPMLAGLAEVPAIALPSFVFGLLCLPDAGGFSLTDYRLPPGRAPPFRCFSQTVAG